MESVENAKLVRRIIDEVINAGNLAAADEIFAPEYVINGGVPGRGRGPEIMKHATIGYRTAFPDLHVSIEDQLAVGDKVVTRERWTGTNLGPFFGRPPTGKSVVGTAITIDRIVNGKIVERWSNGSHHDVLRQLGAPVETG